MQMYLVLIDYGRGRGMEAIVHPEDTRRQIVEQVRDVLASDDLSLVHVKEIDGNYIFDVTEEIVDEANADNPSLPPSPTERQAWAFDHRRDLEKHGV
ncbi:MAG: hypothetical protein WC213_00120 [Arenimonas sp.]|jgi:hypothetical protein